MQQAIFTAHCPYELGDIVEVAIIEGMAIYSLTEMFEKSILYMIIILRFETI